ncbi:hypothetical protein B0T26DRAFT_187814 [Lasiosphaeria miniovina]|uniref:Uncharacterized protein n=1 Tax=Lasiosphaeria miniovina TaxID=1954250 RepID=A0AA40AT77_9PEZI|nr:uncharacterized protein B0T26DRAFT_187814 [Lasiosphaeria miniovina]KAK0721577.1 hypothetical protein B0T26DRAFT_187814 [Lasiosphaeria miniovina]
MPQCSACHRQLHGAARLLQPVPLAPPVRDRLVLGNHYPRSRRGRPGTRQPNAFLRDVHPPPVCLRQHAIWRRGPSRQAVGSGPRRGLELEALGVSGLPKDRRRGQGKLSSEASTQQRDEVIQPPCPSSPRHLSCYISFQVQTADQTDA